MPTEKHKLIPGALYKLGEKPGRCYPVYQRDVDTQRFVWDFATIESGTIVMYIEKTESVYLHSENEYCSFHKVLGSKKILYLFAGKHDSIEWIECEKF
jgi:hypothetical protein